MCGYFCMALINFMMNNKRLKDFTNLFSLKLFLKNDRIMGEHFQ